MFDLPSLSHQVAPKHGEGASLKMIRQSFNNLHFFNNAPSRFSHTKFDQQPSVLGANFEPGRLMKERVAERGIRKQIKLLKEATGKSNNAKHLSKFFSSEMPT